jgi:AcrR family transcriptional regulator
VRRGDEKKQAILNVAERLFYLKGYEQTSVQDLLDVLKASKGSFYHHFESKYAVLETLCAERAEKALACAEEALGKEAESLCRLNVALHFAMPIREGEEQFLTLLLPMIFSENGRTLYTQYSQALLQAFLSKIRALLAQASAEGMVHLYHPDYAADMLMALLNQCWYEAAKHMMDARRKNSAADPAELMEVLQAYRFAMERILDAPFGSLELVGLTELAKVVSRVLSELRLN